MEKAKILPDGKLYYSEKLAFFTKTKNSIILLPTRQDVIEFMVEFNLTEKDIIDLRKWKTYLTTTYSTLF